MIQVIFYQSYCKAIAYILLLTISLHFCFILCCLKIPIHAMEDPGVSPTNFNGSNIDTDTTALLKSVASSPALFESTFAEEDNDLNYTKQSPSSFPSTDDESATCVHPFDGLVLTSWTDIRNAVQGHALTSNKQVSCTAALCGTHKKVYKCVHWLGCRKRHNQHILDLACDKYPLDERMRAEFIRMNPFQGEGACNYSVVGRWNKSKGFHIECSNLNHNRYKNLLHCFAVIL